MQKLAWVLWIGLIGCSTPKTPAPSLPPAPIPSELLAECKKVAPPRSLADDITNNPQLAIQRLIETLTTQYEVLDACKATTEELKQWDLRRIKI